MDCKSLGTGFDPIGSAPVYSALAGVIAGVIFTGIVLLVSIPGDRRTLARQNSLEVLVPTLFTALVSAFLYGVISGEGVCGRADAESLAAGTVLAVLSVATFVALAWILHSMAGDNRLDEISFICLGMVSLFAVAQLTITWADILSDYPNTTWATGSALGYLVAGCAIVGTIMLRWWKGSSAGRPLGYTPTVAIVSTVTINVLLFDFAANGTPNYWSTAGQVPPWVLFGGPATQVAFLACLVALLHSVPGRSSASEARARGGQDPPGVAEE